MSIISRIKTWLLDAANTVLDTILFVAISMILYPLLAFVKIADFVMTIFCSHQYSPSDPDFCYKCGKVSKSNEQSETKKTEASH